MPGIKRIQSLIDSDHFSELKAAARLGLVPDAVRQPAIVAAAAHNAGILAGASAAAAMAGVLGDSGPQPKSERDFILRERKRRTRLKRSKVLTAEQSIQRAAQRYGQK